MTATLVPALIFQGIGFGGLPLPGGKLFSYVAGTSTSQATYTDSTQGTPNSNPVILNANAQAPVWLDPTLTYKFILQDAFGNQIYVTDQVQGSITAAALTALITQSFIGKILYPQTPNETSAFVTFGGSVVQPWYPPGYWDRYGINVTPGTTDMSSAATLAGQVAGKTQCSCEWGATAPYNMTNPVNWTGIRGVTFTDHSSGNLSANVPSVIISHTGHGFDIATSTELTFNNPVIGTTTTPKSIFFSARSASGGGCGLNRLNNCRSAFNANFSWFWYGYGSEENDFYGCTVYNNQSGSGEFSHNQTNPAAYTSTFVTIATGVQSNSENHHYGFGYYNFGNSGVQNEVIWQLENCANVTIRDGTWGVSHGLAYVNILGNSGSNNLTFDSIRGEPLGGGLQPLYGVFVNNTAGTHLSWTFNNVTADAVNELLRFNTAQTPNIQNLNIIGASNCTSGKTLAAYTMSNSVIETLGGNIVTGTVGGTISSCVFMGWRSNITLSGTSSLNTFIDNNTGTIVNQGIGLNGSTAPAQVTGWGVPVGAAVVNNYNITDAGGSNSNTNKALAEIIVYLKSQGAFGA